MKTRPKISVVVPVYNRADLLERCLDSIWLQDVRPLELLIVDNNSTDKSRDVARKWKELHSGESDLEAVLIEEKRQGAAIARQTGAENAAASMLYFMDSDDEMEPGILSAALDVSDGYDMVYWQIKETGINGDIRIHHFSEQRLFQRQLYNAMLCTPSYLVRKDFFMKAGGWNPSIRVWDDLELGMRLLLNKPRIRPVRKIGVNVFQQAESITGLDYLSRRGEWEHTLDIMEQYIREYAAGEGNSKERDGNLRLPDADTMLEIADYRRANLAALYYREGDNSAARNLLETTLMKSRMPRLRKLWLRLLYTYTAHGGRGAYLLWR